VIFFDFATAAWEGGGLGAQIWEEGLGYFTGCVWVEGLNSCEDFGVKNIPSTNASLGDQLFPNQCHSQRCVVPSRGVLGQGCGQISIIVAA